MVETRVTCGTPTKCFFCVGCVTSMESVFSACFFWKAPRSSGSLVCPREGEREPPTFHKFGGRDCQGLVCVFWLDCDMGVRFRGRNGSRHLTLRQGSSLKNASFRRVPTSV